MEPKFSVEMETIHDLDHQGHLAVEVELGEHRFQIYYRWCPCGSVARMFRCSCGFYTEKRWSGSCYDHKDADPRLDAVHAALVLVAAQGVFFSEAAFPEEIEEAGMLEAYALRAIDGSLRSAIAFAEKSAGAPTASALRKQLRFLKVKEAGE